MKFGARKEAIETANEEPRRTSAQPASSTYTAHVGEQPVLASRRLQRMVDYFQTQEQLLEQMREEFQVEIEPLNDLLVDQSRTMQQMLVNLEESLRPLNEYADGEEANLEALERRMKEQDADFVSRSFSEYLSQQRRRIAETREQIDGQRMPFLRYSEDQRDTIEVALSQFDEEMEALEHNLTEQRRQMVKILEAMRSDGFVAVREFLATRQERMAELAAAGETDPGEIGRSVRALRESVDEMASKSTAVKTVLDATDEADQRLSTTAPSAARGLPPEVAAMMAERSREHLPATA